MAVFKIREVLSSFSIKYCILKFEFSKQKLQTGKLQKNMYIYCAFLCHFIIMKWYLISTRFFRRQIIVFHIISLINLSFCKIQFFPWSYRIFIFDKDIPLSIKFSIINHLSFSHQSPFFLARSCFFSINLTSFCGNIFLFPMSFFSFCKSFWKKMKIEMLNAHYVVIFCVGLMLVFMKDN